MEALQKYWTLGHSFAENFCAFAPEYLALIMPPVQDAAFVGSLTWILYRIWEIYKKPVDELVNLLGLDIPPAPDVSLAGITSESVILYLKPPDPQYVLLTHSIHVNGIKVGEINRGETSIQVTGLKPSHFYNIRVIASTTANFSTLGQLIRLRTLPPSELKACQSSIAELVDVDEGYESGQVAAIRPAPAQYESVPVAHMVRESSAGVMSSRRTASGRRNSPASQVMEQSPSCSRHGSNTEHNDPEDSVEDLTRRLDSLRQEQHDMDRQMQEEEAQSKQSIADLTKDRDRLRQVLKEREDGNAELRKQGNVLEKQHRQAQSRKAQKEHLLNQKKAERQKVKDDIVRWDEQIAAIRQETQSIIGEKAEVLSGKDIDIGQLRSGILEDQAAIKQLEEEIRTTGAEIKAIEKDREQHSQFGAEEQQFAQQDRDDDEAWEAKVHAAQAEISRMWRALQQFHLENEQAKGELASWMAAHARDPSQFAPISGLDFAPLGRSSRSRRNRQSNSRTSTISSPSSTYPTGSQTFSSMSSMSPPYAAPTPFFSMGNGTVVAPPSDPPSFPQREADIISGAGPMSPTADELLPSNLFRDEDPMARRVSGSAARGSLGSLGSDVVASRSPQTPVSSDSHNGSQFSSPHESLQNLQSNSSGGDPYTDYDRRSMSSTSASFRSPGPADANSLATNRIASLFQNSVFNRQRGKPGTTDPPQLGTLRQGQSQSFPRNFEQGLDPVGVRQRRGSHSLSNAMGLFNRNTSSDNGVIRSLTGSGKKSRLNTIGPNVGPLQSSPFSDQPSSARPSSISSFDQLFGRPSNESQRYPWGPTPEGIPNRSSPLGAYLTNTINRPFSQNPSRRQSVQHGSTSNLSIGSTPLEPEYQGGLSNKGTDQLPIGTRPGGGSGQSSQQPITPRLNPAAPSFKTLFSRGDAKKAAKADKAAEKVREKDFEVEDTDSAHDEQSPQNPRLSRDAQSIVTSASVSESHDSLDRSTSGTPSEVATPPGPKETLMQRISRKGSSSKFNVPWAKERGGFFGRKTGEPSTPGGSTPHGEFDEDGRSDKHEESPHPVEKSSRSSLSWPNIRRKSKRSGILATEAKDTGSEGGEDEE